MAEEEKFLSRWSRLKREGGAVPTTAAGVASAPVPVELPPVGTLGFDSDFTGFLHGKVDEKLKQAALKKLFHSPHFNQMDGLDVYIDDYNTFEPIPEDMLRELNHAQDLLFRKDEEQRADVSASADDPIFDSTTSLATDVPSTIPAADSPLEPDLPAAARPVSTSGLENK